MRLKPRLPNMFILAQGIFAVNERRMQVWCPIVWTASGSDAHEG